MQPKKLKPIKAITFTRNYSDFQEMDIQSYKHPQHMGLNTQQAKVPWRERLQPLKLPCNNTECSLK